MRVVQRRIRSQHSHSGLPPRADSSHQENKLRSGRVPHVNQRLHSQPARPHLEAGLLHQQVLRRGRPRLQGLPQGVQLQGRLQVATLTELWLALLPAGPTLGRMDGEVTAKTRVHIAARPAQNNGPGAFRVQVAREYARWGGANSSDRPRMAGTQLFTGRGVQQANTLPMLGRSAQLFLGGLNFGMGSLSVGVGVGLMQVMKVPLGKLA